MDQLATATTIQNAQTLSHSGKASRNEDIDAHLGELHMSHSPFKSGDHLETTKSQSDSMVQTQPKQPKDLAQVGHVTPIKYFTLGSSKQRAATPTNFTSEVLNNDSWLEYLNSLSQVEVNEKAEGDYKIKKWISSEYRRQRYS